MPAPTRHVAAAAGAAAVALVTLLGGVAVAAGEAPNPSSLTVASPHASASSTPSISATVDDDGGGLDRDQRFEPGDDRRPNGTPTTSVTDPRHTEAFKGAEPMVVKFSSSKNTSVPGGTCSLVMSFGSKTGTVIFSGLFL